MYFGNKDKKSKWKQRLVTGGMAALIGVAAFCILSASFTAKDKTGESRFWGRTAVWIQKQINRTYLPVFAFMEEETGIHKDAEEFLRDVILLQMPIYKYSEEQAQVQISIEDEDTFDMLIREEGTDEDRKGLEDGALEYEEDALHIDSDLEKAMKEENDSFNQTVEEESKV